MELTLQLKLLPTEDQATALRATMARFNEAYTWLAEQAFAWRPRRGARVLLKALQQTLDGGLERCNACFKGADILLDSNGWLLPQR